ncbi:MAG: single-stranded DNA-binding protein [Sporichthyaceae bacterium]
MSFTPNGKATARMRVAVTDRRRTPTGEWVDGDTSWHTVIAWGKLAEHAAETLTKGQRVIVHGRLAQREWATEDGEKRTAWEITADEIGTSLRHGGPVDPGVYADHDDQPVRIAMTDRRLEQRRPEQRRPVPSGRR